jgi:hypothetical protein
MNDYLAAALAAAFPLAGLGAGLGWWLYQIRRARPVVRREIERLGYQVVTMRPVFWRPWRAKDGPFPRTDTPLTRVVFKLLVHDRGGSAREVWARWGGTSLRLHPDEVEHHDLGAPRRGMAGRGRV